jgi:hypothetical protein
MNTPARMPGQEIEMRGRFSTQSALNIPASGLIVRMNGVAFFCAEAVPDFTLQRFPVYLFGCFMALALSIFYILQHFNCLSAAGCHHPAVLFTGKETA